MGLKKQVRNTIKYLQANIDLFSKDKLSQEHNILLLNMEGLLRKLNMEMSAMELISKKRKGLVSYGVMQCGDIFETNKERGLFRVIDIGSQLITAAKIGDDSNETYGFKTKHVVHVWKSHCV